MARFDFDNGKQIEWWLGKDLPLVTDAKCTFMFEDHNELAFIRKYFLHIHQCRCGTGPHI